MRFGAAPVFVGVVSGILSAAFACFGAAVIVFNAVSVAFGVASGIVGAASVHFDAVIFYSDADSLSRPCSAVVPVSVAVMTLAFACIFDLP